MITESIKHLKASLNISPIGPECIVPEESPIQIKAGKPYRHIFSGLVGGQSFCFADTFGTAMSFYGWLKKQLERKYPVHDYQSSRMHRNFLNHFTKNLLVKITDQQPDLHGAPANGWLNLFHTENAQYHLRFTDFLGMNGSWQWFKNGIQYPGLNHLVHPFYDVYFPTRYEHLILFDNWLGQQQPFNKVVDMGAGCGILSFYMLQHGVKQVTATDTNPNSLLSIALDQEGSGNSMDNLALRQCSFFDGLDMDSCELLVFNPPWVPEATADINDRAIYYDHQFFPDFFEQAYEKLPANCLLVILFSTFAQAAGITALHPIEKELTQHRFSLVTHLQSPVNQPPSKQRHWLSNIRLKEKNELWVLQRNS
jgi:hypothetical protein